MNVACGAEARGRYLWEGDTSNKPFEWTGHHQFSATPPQALCLPLKGSVIRIQQSVNWKPRLVLGGSTMLE